MKLRTNSIERHPLERHLARAARQGLRVFGVDDRGLYLEQAEHLFHVGERPLDLAVDESEEVERQVELDQVSVDEHEVAYRHAAGGDSVAGHDHHQGQPGRNDPCLADVHERKRCLALYRRVLVAPQRAVEAPGLDLLGAEILHRLVVEQAVDGASVSLAVALVHHAAELETPLGHH